MEKVVGFSDAESARSDSPSPRKGEYNVQTDRLSPSGRHDGEVCVSDESDVSGEDSDISDNEGVDGKRGSYDLLAARDENDGTVGDGKGSRYIEKSDDQNTDDSDSDGDFDRDEGGKQGSCNLLLASGDDRGSVEDGNINHRKDGTGDQSKQQCNSVEGDNCGDDEKKKMFVDRDTDNESDEDEYFDAITDMDTVGTAETTEPVLPDLPDSSVVRNVDNLELDGEPPPPPSTALPVLQSLRPDIVSKFSLSQGWLDRVNRSLVESSGVKDHRHIETSSEPETGRETNMETVELCSSYRRKSHALLDKLKKSASDNRHDYVPNHVVSKRSPKKDSLKSPSDENSRKPHDQVVSQDQGISDCASQARDGTIESDDTVPSTTSKLRRTAYVTTSRYRSRFLARPGGVRYGLPRVGRCRTDCYMRAVYGEERPNPGQGTEQNVSVINFTKMEHSGSFLPVRSSVEGALLPAWTSLPAFSSLEDTGPSSLVKAGRRTDYVHGIDGLSVNKSSFPSPAKYSDPLSDSTYHERRSDKDLSQERAQNRYEESSLPLGLGNSDEKKKKNRQHRSQIMNGIGSTKPPCQTDHQKSVQDVSRDSRVDLRVRFTDPITIENGSTTQQDASTDYSRKGTHRSDYQLTVDSENDVMRVNNAEPHGLMRKPVVRRKAATVQSKTLPRNTGSSINKRRRAKETSRLESNGSSLDLTPSLLELYDGIIASASRAQESPNTEFTAEQIDGGGQLAVDQHLQDDISAQIFTNNTLSSRQHRGSLVDSTSPNGHIQYATSGSHKRTGSGGKQQLPSLSVPPDRPVSMAEAEVLATSSGQRGSVVASNKDTKQKRPLSLSTGIVPSLPSSTHSSSAVRQRQQVHSRGNNAVNSIDEDMVSVNESEELSESRVPASRKCRGLCTKAQAGGSAFTDSQRLMPSSVTITSESRNSIDSGCVLPSHNNADSTRDTDLKATNVQRTSDVVNDESLGPNKSFCSCYLYDSTSMSSSDTTGSGSFSSRDEVDSSTSSIRDGSAPLLAPLSSSSSSSSPSSSSSSLHPANDKTSREDAKHHKTITARRSITGLPGSDSESFLLSSPSPPSSTRRYTATQHLSPSNLPLGHHYPSYQPLDERLAASPEATSKYLGVLSPANDSGLAADHQMSLSSTPGSRLTGPIPSPWSNSSCTDESTFTGPESPESSGPSSKTCSTGARRSNSFSKTEARKRFFSNYEEHMRQVESEQKELSCPDISPKNSPAPPSSDVTEQNHPLSQLAHSSHIETNKTNLEASSELETDPQECKNTPHDCKSHTLLQSSPDSSSQPQTSSKSQSTTTPMGLPAGPRLSSSRSIKRREASSTSSDVRAAGPGYVTYVQRVVAEILESERTYIASLKDIIQGYLEPMEQILGNTEAKEDLACLFGNIRDIFKFGCGFLADLELTALDPVKVAECFVKHNKGFVIYTDYCTNYPRAVEILTRFMQDPDLSELCKERQLALGHGLPLGAYLLRPVQRILKYHLLLQNIVKNCEKEAGGGGSRSERGSTSSTNSGSGISPGASAILEQAFQHMTQMASHINEMKRKHEHAVRIQEIQSQLEDYVGEDLTRLGELVLESTFRVYGAKASRQVFLFERGLLISKKKEGGMLSCKTFIRCSNLMLVEVIPNEPLSFHTIPFDNPRAQYTLQARNMEQKRRWCQEMKRLILESYKEKIPDNVKSLVMQLGRNHDDDYVTKEALEAVRKNQHTAPEYLEKRRFRRKSGPRLPDFSLLKPQRGKKGANNKKGDNKGVEINKLSPEMTRRAESKSPDSHRKFLIKQMTKKRSQSQTASLPTTPISDMAYLEMFENSGDGKKHVEDDFNSDSEDLAAKTEEVKVNRGEQQNQPQHALGLANSTTSLPTISSLIAMSVTATSPGSAVLPPNSLPSQTQQADLGTGVGTDGTDPPEDKETIETLVTKRASSFRKALRAHPITSADISELVVRCGGAGLSPRKTSATKSNTSTAGSQGESQSESVDFKSKTNQVNTIETSMDVTEEPSNSNRVTSGLDESENEEGELQGINSFKLSNEDLKNQISEVSRAISNGSFLSHKDMESEEKIPSSYGFSESDTSVREKSIYVRSASLPLLDDSDENEDYYDNRKYIYDNCRLQIKESENSLGPHKTSPPGRHQQPQCSHSVEDLCGEHKTSTKKSHGGQGRMSRRDLQDRAAQLKKETLRSQNTNTKGSTQASESDSSKPKRVNEVLSNDLNPSQTPESKSKTDEQHLSDKAVLLRKKVKGLRLPNTHKHLSVQDYSSTSALRDKTRTDACRARLIGWSSAEKLTRGSMTDLSHLAEDPWVRNTEVLPGKKSEQSTSVLPEHQRHSTTLSSTSSGDGSSKENLDWLVYLNRNSNGGSSSSLKPLSSHPVQISSQKPQELVNKPISASVADGINIPNLPQSEGKMSPEDWNKMSLSSPPRALMTLKNMHKVENSKGENLGNDVERNLRKFSQSVSASNLCSANIKLARPVKLEEASSLSRSNSLPITSCHGQGMSYHSVKSISRARDSSVQNVEHLSEQESAQRMIAEMEEYIKAVTEPSPDSAQQRGLPQKFPTTLPAITVEEEDTEVCDDEDVDDTRPPGSNRLSVISSASTSSYESQASWSSGASEEGMGGMMGSLRHKLHAWAKDSYPGEEQEKGDISVSDSSTIHLNSIHTADEECGKDKTQPGQVYFETGDVKDDPRVSSARNTYKKGPESQKKSFEEERQLETVLREHSLGSSSLGLRMAQASSLSENPSLTPMPSRTLQTNKLNSANAISGVEQEGLPGAEMQLVNNSISSESHKVGWASSSVCDINTPVSKDISSHNQSSSSTFPTDPLPSRFSLPPTTEATEALIPAALRDERSEIQQSDSGFSLQSTTSSTNDGSGSNGDLFDPLDALTEKYNTDISATSSGREYNFLHDSDCTVDGKKLSDEFQNSHTVALENFNSNKSSDCGLKRSESFGSMDSTDSFYERRLSIAFESDDFHSPPSVIKAGQDLQFDERCAEIGGKSAESSRFSTMSSLNVSSEKTFPLTQTDQETPLSRKSIREYIQSIEAMFKPQSPKMVEVRRREPGAMIRERLQNLRDQANYGNSERGHGYARSKSQPPSQHRSGLLPSSSHSSLSSTTSGCVVEGASRGLCSDDIMVNDFKVSGSRDSLVSLSNTPQATTLWGSRESVFFPSRSKDRLHSLSKERLSSSRDCLLNNKRTSSIDLMRTSSTELVTRESILASPVLARKNKKVSQRHTDQHPIAPNVYSAKTGHDKTTKVSVSSPTGQGSQWNRTNQFVHRARSSSDRSSVSLSERASSPVHTNSDSGKTEVESSPCFFPSSPHQISRSTGGLDQMSTEVDNLIIMKGWVRSLISKFQDQT